MRIFNLQTICLSLLFSVSSLSDQVTDSLTLKQCMEHAVANSTL